MLRIKINLVSILEYILAFFLVLECNSVYQRSTERDLHLNWMCIFIVLCLATLTISRRLVKKNLFRTCVLVCILVIYLFLTFTKSNVISFVELFCLFFPIMMVYLQGKSNIKGILSIYDKFSIIVIWLVLISTVVWFFTEIVGLIEPNMSININWGTRHSVNGVLGVFFRTQKDTTFGISIYRNSGIFCEAPMFNLVACLALIYELFLREKYNKKGVLILVLGILSSITSTGLVILGVCVALWYFDKIKENRNVIKYLYIAGGVIVIPIFVIFLQSLLETKSTTGSFSMRIADYIIGFRAFYANPLTGTGFNNLSNLLVEQSKVFAQLGIRNISNGFSNSIMGVLGQGGLYLFYIYMYPFLKLLQCKSEDLNNINYTMWLIVFSALFVSTIFYAKYIMIYFLVVVYTMCMFNYAKRENE